MKVTTLKYLIGIPILAIGLYLPTYAVSTTKEKKMVKNPYDLSEFAPEFNKLTQEQLNGDIWKRPPLSARDKSLVTITILVSMSRWEQLDPHLIKALDNGLTKDEIVAAMTHVAFYAGWPAAYSGIMHLKAIVEKRQVEKK